MRDVAFQPLFLDQRDGWLGCVHLLSLALDSSIVPNLEGLAKAFIFVFFWFNCVEIFSCVAGDVLFLI